MVRSSLTLAALGCLTAVSGCSTLNLDLKEAGYQVLHQESCRRNLPPNEPNNCLQPPEESFSEYQRRREQQLNDNQARD